FKVSRCFTRAQIQELPAPLSVLFFEHSCKRCDIASDLYKAINTITGIDAPEVVRAVSRYSPRFWQLGIARCMSSAANQQTNLVEDRDYSFLRLFDLNMPLIYGEREQACIPSSIRRNHQRQ
ncbi:uncharacterized protein NECHADRAFT_56547, partial [Fusarium vanettenii 77-13-4]